jgi:hypothetical protein
MPTFMNPALMLTKDYNMTKSSLLCYLMNLLGINILRMSLEQERELDTMMRTWEFELDRNGLLYPDAY